MIIWELIAVFATSFGVTSYCVYNNCLNYNEEPTYFHENIINNLQDSYKISRIDEKDYK